MFVLNFYSPIFIDQLKRGRKTATIRLGDKGNKYRKGEVVLVTVGFQHSPREKIFEAVDLVVRAMRPRIEETEKTDLVTQDLLIEVVGTLEEARWMWQAQNVGYQPDAMPK